MKPFAIIAQARQAARNGYRSVRAQIGDMVRLRFGPQRLFAQEYFDYRLYDPAFSRAAQDEFYGNWAKGSLFDIQDPQWFALADDKLASYQALKGVGLPFPHVVAVAHAQRAFPGAARLSSLAETRAWLLDPRNYPFFGKPAAGTFGQSVCYALGIDVAANRIDLFGGKTASIDETAKLIFSDRAHGYLLQQLVRPSAQMTEIMGDVVPTARIISVMTTNGVFLHQAVLRVPRGDLPTDNYAKGASGTGAAWIDVESGILGPVHWGSGLGQKRLDDHPVTGARIAGLALLGWTDITEMLIEGHRYFPGLPLIGWDIAFSDEGPLILELNATSGYIVLQATGHGFVDDRLRAAIPLAKPTRMARFPRLNVSGSNMR